MNTIWMLIAVSIGLAIGWAIGNEVRRRKNAEEKVDDLRSLLKHPGPPALERQLKRMHGTLDHRLWSVNSNGCMAP